MRQGLGCELDARNPGSDIDSSADRSSACSILEEAAGCELDVYIEFRKVWRKREKEEKMDNNKIYQMKFSKIYPLLVSKAERKDREKTEVDQVICWLTGYNEKQIEEMAVSDITYKEFFEQAPSMNPNRKLIRGSVCGIKVELIKEPLMQEIRYLDKLIDELAKGKNMEKILRK